jgi:hypothetical protein
VKHAVKQTVIRLLNPKDEDATIYLRGLGTSAAVLQHIQTSSGFQSRDCLDCHPLGFNIVLCHILIPMQYIL